MEEFIDMDTWNRRNIFDSFLDTVTCYTALLDCTQVFRYARSRRLPFLATLMHALLDAVNAVPEFRLRIIDGDTVVGYSAVNLVTTELSDDGMLYPMFTGYTPRAGDFVRAYRQRQAETRPPREKGDPRTAHINTLRVCVLPGLRFTSVPCHDDQAARRGSMFMNIGARDIDSRGRVTVPVGVTFAHSLLVGADFSKLARYISHEYVRKQQGEDCLSH